LHRPRILVLLAGLALAVAVALSPALAAVALAADPTVVVRPGDTLTAISKRSGVPIRRLVELNRIANPNRIYAGQRLRIGSGSPAARSRTTDTTGTRIHVVKLGSTLSHIALRYGVSVSSIVAANGIADPSRIFAGQRLEIPGGRSVSGPASGPKSSRAMPASMAAVMAERDGMRRIIVNAADRWGVPRALALAVAWQESGWQQGVVSHAGAVGVMQLMPATADWVGSAMLRAPVDIHDTQSNVNAGVRLLKHYIQRYSGNSDLVLAAYYQGQHAVDHHGTYSVSRPYIASIRHLERLLGG
jgi:LysM repeat protein